MIFPAALRVAVASLLVVSVPAMATEEITANWSFAVAQTTAGTGANTDKTLWGQANDRLNVATKFSVKICIDSAVFACPNSITVLANCQAFNRVCSGASNSFGWSPADGVIGAVNPADGAEHKIYAWAIHTQAPNLDVLLAGSPQTFTWDTARNNFLWYDRPVTTTASPVTALLMGVLINRSDPYSIGVAGGADVCTSGSDHLKPDGVGGHFVSTYGIPCGNVIYGTLSVTNTVTLAAFNTAFGTQLNAAAVTGTVQAMTAVWGYPSIVTGGTTSGTSAHGNCINLGTQQPCTSTTALIYNWPINGATIPTGVKCAGKAYGPGWAAENPAFNSGTTGSLFTAYNVWPTAMLGWARCPTCSASPSTNSTQQWVENVADAVSAIDASHAAIGTNPSGVSTLALTTTTTTGPNMSFPPGLLGSGLNPLVNIVRVGVIGAQVPPGITAASLIANTLVYSQNAQAWTYTVSNKLQAKAGAGIALATGSLTGSLLQSTGSGQTPAQAWMTQSAGAMTDTPFTAGWGTAIEPCLGIPNYQPDLALLIAYELAGWPITEAIAKATRLVLKGNLYGDPFMQPYTPPLPSFTPTGFMVHAAPTPKPLFLAKGSQP